MPNRSDATKPDWNVLVIPALTGGLNVQALPHMIEETQSPNVFGLRPDRGELVQDSGFSYFDTNDGSAGHSAVVYGTPLAQFEFNRLSGTSEALLITTKTAYKLVSGRWEFLGDGVDTTLGVEELAGSTIMTVLSTVGFVVGRYVGVYLDNGMLHMAEVTSLIGGIHIFPGIPAGRTAPLGAGVFQAPLYTAADIDHVTGVTLPSADAFVFTNGVDYIQYYDGATVERMPGTAAANIEACTTLTLWKSYLLLGGTKESGAWSRWRVRRSDTGDFAEWSAGDAGYDNLADAKDDILAMRPLGDYNIIYRARSVIRQEYIGSAEHLFRYRTLTHGSLFESTGVGVVSPSGVFASLDRHYFVASDGIYEYAGGYSIKRISTAIDDTYFSRDGLIAADDLWKIRVGYDEENHIIMFFVRTADAPTAYNNRIILLDIIEGGWFIRKLPFATNGVGVFRYGDATPWGSLVGSWAQQTWTWGGASVSASTPKVVLGTKRTVDLAWRMAEYGISGLDLDENIEWSLETRDIDAYDRFINTYYFEAVVSGEGIEVAYSTDRGLNWNVLNTWVPVRARQRMREHHVATTNVLRYRLKGSGGGGVIGDITIKFREASRW